AGECFGGVFGNSNAYSNRWKAGQMTDLIWTYRALTSALGSMEDCLGGAYGMPSSPKTVHIARISAAFTENFTHKIGQGGFRSVFWGELPRGNQIDIKVLSLFSKQGVAQFLNE
ncbi:hypothetical protein KI387_030735, partial [Taxus chinensis]